MFKMLVSRGEERMKITEIIVIVLLSVCAIEDIKEKVVSMSMIVGFGALGVIVQCCLRNVSIWSVLGGMGIGLLIIVLSCLTKGGIGIGDGMLLITTGIYLGVKENFLLLLVALFGVALWALLLILIQKITFKKEIPFIPFVWAAYVGMLIL